MYLPRRAGAAALCAAFLLPACGGGTESVQISGAVSLTSVAGPDQPAQDDPMRSVLGETARLTLSNPGRSTWHIEEGELGIGTSAHAWQRGWSYAADPSGERLTLEPDASGYLQVVVAPAFSGRAPFLVATRFETSPTSIAYAAVLFGEGFDLRVDCVTNDAAVDAAGLPQAPGDQPLGCTVKLCRTTPPLCLQGPARLRFDVR